MPTVNHYIIAHNYIPNFVPSTHSRFCNLKRVSLIESHLVFGYWHLTKNHTCLWILTFEEYTKRCVTFRASWKVTLVTISFLSFCVMRRINTSFMRNLLANTCIKHVPDKKLKWLRYQHKVINICANRHVKKTNTCIFVSKHVQSGSTLNGPNE